ncbi:hypothetical protein GCM10020256_10550 [Streptomyces thermocoprophilus]
MKTCHQFKTVRAEYEREIGFMLAHSERHAGQAGGEVQREAGSLGETADGPRAQQPRRTLPRMRLNRQIPAQGPYP